MDQGSPSVALSTDLTKQMQMAGWLYWRMYETTFRKSDFEKRFNTNFDKVYGRQMKILQLIGFLKSGEDRIILSDNGTYWIHAFEDFSIF